MYIKDKYVFLVGFFSKSRKIIFNVNKKYLKKINFKKLWKDKYYHYMFIYIFKFIRLFDNKTLNKTLYSALMTKFLTC